MIFDFEARCVLQMEWKDGMPNSTHIQTKFNLDVSKNLQRDHYLDQEGLPTAEGVKALTNTFIQGLVGNIHHAREKGYWNDSEHIRYIISELERGFVQNVESSKSNF